MCVLFLRKAPRHTLTHRKKAFVIDLTCARLQVIGDKIKNGMVLQGILKEKVKLLDRGDQSIIPRKEFEELIG